MANVDRTRTRKSWLSCLATSFKWITRSGMLFPSRRVSLNFTRISPSTTLGPRGGWNVGFASRSFACRCSSAFSFSKARPASRWTCDSCRETVLEESSAQPPSHRQPNTSPDRITVARDGQKTLSVALRMNRITARSVITCASLGSDFVIRIHRFHLWKRGIGLPNGFEWLRFRDLDVAHPRLPEMQFAEDFHLDSFVDRVNPVFRSAFPERHQKLVRDRFRLHLLIRLFGGCG